MEYHPNDYFLASSDAGGSLTVWDLEKSTELLTYERPGEDPSAFAFAQDGAAIYVACKTVLKVGRTVE